MELFTHLINDPCVIYDRSKVRADSLPGHFQARFRLGNEVDGQRLPCGM